jgi:hypothetical protein
VQKASKLVGYMSHQKYVGLGHETAHDHLTGVLVGGACFGPAVARAFSERAVSEACNGK